MMKIILINKKRKILSFIFEIDKKKSKKIIRRNDKESDVPWKPPKIIMMALPRIYLIKHADFIFQKYKLININIYLL